MSIRIASIDDDTVIRLALPLLLPHIEVLGTYQSTEKFLIVSPNVDVVLLDLHLSSDEDDRAQGARAVARVAAAGHRVLLYTNERRREVLAGCIAAGAHGITHKTDSIQALADAIDKVAAGGLVIPHSLTGLIELLDRRGATEALTPRQREVLSARARGESFAAIAERLYISKRTAEDHMAKATSRFAEYLRTHSPADLERRLGIGPGDLLD
ncbi:LuxR C-terminal-related transcriptional regulator [uncultured Jatrophihabitans sp.]|uniref:LuxR C-terminal-related transcriptional regulator n=1 Tax=uncultured Jatrophihabitans sp. TaxID=1610747 RepID=UPI0035CBBC50